MSVFLQPIYTQTLNANASSITFNNIPQGFTDLKIVVSGRSTEATLWDNLYWTFNNNSGNNYSANQASGYPTNAPGADRLFGWVNSGFYPHLPTTSATANLFSNTEIYIPNYSSGKAKSWLCTSVSERNASTTTNYTPELLQAAGVFISSSPITSITFRCYAQLAQYTTITIYGVSTVYDTGSPTAPTIGTVTDLGGIASVAFTANDSGQGRTADNYSVYDPAIMSAPVYAQTSPVIVPVTVGATYNTLAVSANNAVGSNTSANPAGFTSYNNLSSIASFSFGSSAASVTFSNIPQGYRHLLLRMTTMSADTGSRQLDMGFNGDGSQIYTFHQYYGANTTVSGSTSAPRNDIPEVSIMRANNQTKPGVSYLYIYDYKDTAKFKTVHWYMGNEDQTSGYIQQATGMYRSLAPVSAISLVGRGGSIGTNSHIALYGIG